jgi:hypothetical protein
MAVVVLGIDHWAAARWSPLTTLAVEVMTGCATYWVALQVLCVAAYRDVVAVMRRRVSAGGG